MAAADLRLLVLSVFVVASCGIAYELVNAAMASYLLGDSVFRFSSIIGTYLFAMGCGAAMSRFVTDRQLLTRFIDIELAVGLIGGVSAALLFSAYAAAGVPFSALLYSTIFLIGVLVGMEIPLVMRILNARQVAFSDLVSRVLAFDSLGALAVSLLFPLVLAPMLGLMRTAFLFGAMNVAVALWTLKHFRSEVMDFKGRLLRAVVVFGVLAMGFAYADRLTTVAERRLFGDEVIFAETTPYQRLSITRWKDDVRLYINGNLQFSSRDEHRYHEALVHPVMAPHRLVAANAPMDVLVLGGGDGLGLREILKYPNVRSVVLVDLDPDMTRLFKDNAQLAALNSSSFHDTRVRIVNADAMNWLQESSEAFDAIVVDFPDPSNFALGKLYSVSFYELLQRHLRPHGRMSVQSTSPYFAPRAFWSVHETLKAAGWHARPYHAHVPSFGEWGFMLATREPVAAPDKDAAIPVTTRFLTPELMAQLFTFPPDMQQVPAEVNRLSAQPLIRYLEEDWARHIR